MKRLIASCFLVVLMLLSFVTVSGQTTSTAEYQIKADVGESDGKVRTVYTITCQKTDLPIYAIQIAIPYDANAMTVGEVTFGGKYKSCWQYNDTGSQLVALFLSSDMKENSVTSGEEIMTFVVTSTKRADNSFLQKWQIDSGSFDTDVIEMTSNMVFVDNTEEKVPEDDNSNSSENNQGGTEESSSENSSQTESEKTPSNTDKNKKPIKNEETSQQQSEAQKSESRVTESEKELSSNTSNSKSPTADEETSSEETISQGSESQNRTEEDSTTDKKEGTESSGSDSSTPSLSKDTTYGIYIGIGVLLIVLCVAGVWLYQRRKMK